MRLLERAGTPGPVLAAVGDIGIVGAARARAAREGWDAPFAAMAPALAGADLAFANLEFPVGERAWVRPGRSEEFFHDAAVPAALARAGVRVVSLANNHMMDCGPRGLEATLAACRAAGLSTVGAGPDLEAARAPARFVLHGRRVLLLACATATDDAAGPGRPGIAPLEIAALAADLRRWRGEADLLVVSAHWGSMYVDYPPPRAVEAARALVEAGADVVLGHHPHVLQGVERRGRSVVLYSLGDAAFNCRAGDFHASVAAGTRLESAVFRIEAGADAHGVEALPLKLDDDGFPRAPGAADAAAQGERLARLSTGLADAAAAFAAEGAPRLLKYELESLWTYVRTGRWGRAVRLLGALRPRHLPLLAQALSGRSRKRQAPERPS
jgi:poly-gamma-glutamate synthesis protein (capsule biosynthesis protein)